MRMSMDLKLEVNLLRRDGAWTVRICAEFFLCATSVVNYNIFRTCGRGI